MNKIKFIKAGGLIGLAALAITVFVASSLTPKEIKSATSASTTEQTDLPKVYFTKEITPQALMRIYHSLGRKAEGKNVAIKVTTGEPGGNNFLKPAFMRDLVQSVNGTIIECNTAYGGGRSTTENHLKAARDHGFMEIAKVDIMDADGDVELPIKNGTRMTRDIVG